MSFEEDTELRDLVIETLEKKGVLGKIKAELRATVFLALEDSEFEKCKIPLRNVALQKFMESDEGLTTVAFVRDFLVTFNLDYTLAVFDPEVSSPKPLKSRQELEERFNLTNLGNQNVPLLTTVLDQLKNNPNLNIKDAASVALPDQSVTKTLEPKENTEIKHNQKIHVPDNVSNSKSDIETKQSDDIFLNDSVPNSKKEPLLFSFFGANAAPAKTVNPPPAQTENPNHTFVTKNESSNLESTDSKHNEGTTDSIKSEKRPSLSSLQDLPVLGPPKVNKGLDYEDDFQSSLSSHSAKSDDKGNKEGTRDDVDGSVEEEIEEDLSISADDLLNTSSSHGDDTTSDRTVSQLSGKNSDIVYTEKLS